MSADDSLPDDVEALKNLLRARDAELARARAEASSAEALIAHLRLAIEKMRCELYGQRSERKARLLDQMGLELEELEASAAEDELAARKVTAASGDTMAVRAFTPKMFHVLVRARAKKSECLRRYIPRHRAKNGATLRDGEGARRRDDVRRPT